MTPAKQARALALARVGALLVPVVLLAALAVQRRWMDDDGFINLRVVRNLLAGFGPVYNVGERVEVGTSPLWVALLTLLGAARIRLETAAVYGGIVCALVGVMAGLRGSVSIDARAIDAHATPPSRRLLIPLGALSLAVLPPSWEYASSGLETGLTFAWLGVSFALLVRALHAPERPRALCLAAFVSGLGPLVRPEAALYSAAMLVPLALSARQSSRPARRLVTVAVVALALPVAYQIFRMGYYGALAPNTSIAKESTLANWKQGACYARNFFGRYRLAWPLLLAATLGYFRLHARWRAGERPVALALALLPLAALVHAVYIVRVGGDYMHGRMFLPVMFAALLPVFTVEIALDRSVDSTWLGVLALATVPWWLLCGLTLRVREENQCGIGDEHGWYVRESRMEHPIRIEDYAEHSFGKAGIDRKAEIEKRCAHGASSPCRQLFFDDRDHGHLYPWRSPTPLAADVDRRIDAVVAASAIGMTGYQLPANVHLVDHLGLADPIAARLTLEKRARPGHEKDLPSSWIGARFAAPLPYEDVSIAAARRALRCGLLAELEDATRAPLTAARFVANLGRAFALQRLRIPVDPFAAEAAFCGVAVPDVTTTGGDGGGPFRWQCPDGQDILAIRGGFASPEPDEHETSDAKGPQPARVTWLRAQCTTNEGPRLGAGGEQVFAFMCPSGSVAVGLGGRSADHVGELRLECARKQPGGAYSPPTPTDSIGDGTAAPFELACAPGKRMIGLAGRDGEWIDALGPVCN